MVDSSTILQTIALPTSHTPAGIFKLELTGGLLVFGILVATYGFRRWYLLMYEDWLLQRKKEELIEAGTPFNPEDYEPPLRSHIVNYIFLGLGVVLAVSGVAIWLLPS